MFYLNFMLNSANIRDIISHTSNYLSSKSLPVELMARFLARKRHLWKKQNVVRIGFGNGT